MAGPVPTPRSTATQAPPARVALPAKIGGSYQFAAPTVPAPNLQGQAIGEAQNSILPQVQSLAAQRASAAASTAQAQQSTEQAYQALTNLLKTVSPTIGGAYRTAALDQGMLAKGFADGLAHIQSQAAAQTAPQLGADSPQQAQATAALGGTGSQNAVYGLGGYIPGAALNREGAAFQAAAASLPGTAAGEGLQQVQALGAKQALTDAGFDSKQADLMARIPGLAQTALDHLTSAKESTDYHAATLKQGDARIAESVAHDKALETASTNSATALANYRDATLTQGNARIAASAAKVAAGQVPTYNATNSRSLGYAADQYGNPLPDSKGNLHLLPGNTYGPNGTIVKTSTAKGRAPSSAATRLKQEYTGSARRIAEGSFKGFSANTKTPSFRVLTADPGDGQPWSQANGTAFIDHHPPLSYYAALDQMLLGDPKNGAIPLPLALQQLNRIYRPGQQGRPPSQAQTKYVKGMGLAGTGITGTTPVPKTTTRRQTRNPRAPASFLTPPTGPALGLTPGATKIG